MAEAGGGLSSLASLGTPRPQRISALTRWEAQLMTSPCRREAITITIDGQPALLMAGIRQPGHWRSRAATVDGG